MDKGNEKGDAKPSASSNVQSVNAGTSEQAAIPLASTFYDGTAVEASDGARYDDDETRFSAGIFSLEDDDGGILEHLKAEDKPKSMALENQNLRVFAYRFG